MGLSPRDAERYRHGLNNMTDEATERYGGSWVRTSDDGGLTWDEPVRVPVSSPHGPNRLANGDLVYLGKTVGPDEIGQVMNTGSIGLIRSGDGGRTWTALSSVPLPDGLDVEYFHEPHVVELGDGRLLGLIRYDPNHHDYGNRQPGQTDFPDVPDRFTRRREDLEQGADHGLPRLTASSPQVFEWCTRNDIRLPRAALRYPGNGQPRTTERPGVRLHPPPRRASSRSRLSIQRGAWRRKHPHRLLPAASQRRRQVRPPLEPLDPTHLDGPCIRRRKYRKLWETSYPR